MAYSRTKILESGDNTKTVIAIPEWAQQLLDREGQFSDASVAFAKTPQLYRAVQLRANALACVPFIIKRGETAVDWPLPDPLPKLLFELECGLCVCGAAYALKLNPKAGTKKVVGLQVLTPTTMEVRYLKQEISFLQRIRGQVYGPWGKDRMFYMREFSFTDEVGPGLAPAKVALPAAQLRISMQEFATGFFGSGAQPLTLLTITGNPPPAELERTERFFKRTINGVKNAWRVLAVRSEVSVQPITPDINTMAMPELHEATTREIAACFGIPLSVLTSDSASYATAQSDMRLFYENTIKARLMMYEMALNDQLLGEMGLTISFTPEALPIYQEDEAERSGALVNLVQAGIPLKDAMLILGYAVEDVTGLDAEQETVSTAPSPNAEAVAKPIVAKPAPSTGQELLTSAMTKQTNLENVADTAHRQQMQNEIKMWAKVAAKNRQRAMDFDCRYLPSEMANWVKAHLAQPDINCEHIFAHIPTKTLVLNTPAERALAKLINAVFEQYETQIKSQAGLGIIDYETNQAMMDDLEKRLEPIMVSVYLKQIANITTSTGVPLAKEVATSRAIEWADTYIHETLAEELKATTIRDIQKMVGKLVGDNALSPQEVALGLFPTFSPYRVAMIARTEVTRAKSAAANGYAKSLREDGLDVVLRWTTRADEKVCPICGPLDNKKEDIYQKSFSDGPPAHVNCRCSIGTEMAGVTDDRGIYQGEVIA